MWNKILVVLAALTIVGCSLAVAQERPARDMMGMPQMRPTAEDLGAYTDARIAALKAGLKLTPEQEKAWPAFEQAYRNLAQLRSERRADGPAPRPDVNIIDQWAQRADAVGRFGGALKDLANAAAPLYQSLDDGQKRRFVVLARLGPRRFAHWRGGRAVDSFGGRRWGGRAPEQQR